MIAKFLEDLKQNGFGNKARKIHRNVCMLWNRAVANIDPWPKQRLTVPDYRQNYVVPWASFPKTLKADFEAYLLRLSGGDILEDVDVLSP